MTFGQLKSSYFEECDGVHNSKLWIVEIWTFGQLNSSYFEECDGVHNSKLRIFSELKSFIFYCFYFILHFFVQFFFHVFFIVFFLAGLDRAAREHPHLPCDQTPALAVTSGSSSGNCNCSDWLSRVGVARVTGRVLRVERGVRRVGRTVRIPNCHP